MLERHFPRSVASLPSLVAFVREFFASSGLDDERAYDVDLVLEELFVNMVRHARGGRPEVAVGLALDGDSLTLTLRDFDVEPWNPAAAPRPDLNRSVEDYRPGGLGLHLVRIIAQDLRYDHDDGTTTLTAVLKVAS